MYVLPFFVFLIIRLLAPILVSSPIVICCKTIEPAPKKFLFPITTSPDKRTPGIKELQSKISTS